MCRYSFVLALASSFASLPAQAVMLASADGTVSGSLYVTGLPAHPGCASGASPYSNDFASGSGFGTVRIRASASNGCIADSDGVYRTEYDLDVSSTAGLFTLDDGIVVKDATATASLNFCGGNCQEFEVVDPITITWGFDLDYALSALTEAVAPGHGTGLRTFEVSSVAGLLGQAALCTYDSRPFECSNQVFRLDVGCPSGDPDGCDEALTGNSAQAFQFVIDEPGIYWLTTGVSVGASTRLFAATFVPEPDTGSLMGLAGIVLLLTGRLRSSVRRR